MDIEVHLDKSKVNKEPYRTVIFIIVINKTGDQVIHLSGASATHSSKASKAGVIPPPVANHLQGTKAAKRDRRTVAEIQIVSIGEK